MSWSVAAIGKAPAVRKVIADQFAKGGKCVEPEESIRLSAASVIDGALAAQTDDTVVNVAASGSMSFKDWNAKEGPSNNLTITVSTMYNFCE